MFFNSLRRARLERDEGWKQYTIPEIRFPADWVIQMVPPFGGALARFKATNTYGVTVSVYYDVYGALGACDQPYWEVYPVDGPVIEVDCDTSRWFGTDTTSMISYIARLGDPIHTAAYTLGGEDAISFIDEPVTGAPIAPPEDA